MLFYSIDQKGRKVSRQKAMKDKLSSERSISAAITVIIKATDPRGVAVTLA